MSKKDYYEVLGLNKNASADEIKRAYRKMAREYHPDVNKTAGSTEKFKEINEAYQILSDPNKRSQYDYYGTAGGQAGQGQGFGGFDFGGGFQGFENFGEFSDIFDVFFGGGKSRRSGPSRGADLRYDLRITLEQAAKGMEKEIEIPHFVSCSTCHGSGAKAGSKPAKCSNCNGSGQIRKTQRTILGSFQQIGTCPACHGSGQIIKDPCPACHGSGREKKKHKVTVKVPAGIDSGYRLRVAGAGDAGEKGAPAGDLYVFIMVEPHGLFNREGDNLYFQAKISFIQAILGDAIEIPTLTGTATLKIPKGTQPNTTFKIKNQGVPNLNHRDKGHLFVLVQIDIPTHLSREQEELLKKYRET